MEPCARAYSSRAYLYGMMIENGRIPALHKSDNSLGAWRKRINDYRLSSDGPALSFFAPPIPIFFKNGGHVRGDGIGPGVAIVAAVVAVQVTEIRNECRAWIDRKKNFFENWIRDRNAIIGLIFRMLIVQYKVERCESELSPIENAGRGQFRIVHFLDDVRRNFLGRIAIIGREGVEHVLVPNPVLQHL